MKGLDEKKLRLWTLGGVIHEVVNIGVPSMAAFRRPLLQGEAALRATVSGVGS